MVEAATESPPPAKRHVFRRFFTDLFRLPRTYKGILLFAAAIAGLGWIHYFYQPAAQVPSPSPAFANHEPAAASTDANSTAQPQHSIQSYLASLGRRVGASVLLGYVIGWIFRTFLKIMATGTLLLAGLLTAASYFRVLNVDFTAVAEQKYKDSSAWITDQADRLRDAALAHLHSTSGGAIGAFLGFRKKTV